MHGVFRPSCPAATIVLHVQISPVWYQVRAGESGSGFQLTGGHDVDQGWIARLREPVVQEGQCSGDADASQTCSSDASVSQVGREQLGQH
jgi:hypothetical protein